MRILLSFHLVVCIMVYTTHIHVMYGGARTISVGVLRYDKGDTRDDVHSRWDLISHGNNSAPLSRFSAPIPWLNITYTCGDSLAHGTSSSLSKEVLSL
jgi:hypothetical protein